MDRRMPWHVTKDGVDSCDTECQLWEIRIESHEKKVRNSGAAEGPKGVIQGKDAPTLERWGLEREELGMGWEEKLTGQAQNSNSGLKEKQQ